MLRLIQFRQLYASKSGFAVHRQIYVRKKISIRCNRIEHWAHLRCAGIRLAQYTDTWTPRHSPRHWPNPTTHSPFTPPEHRQTSHTQPVPTGFLKHISYAKNKVAKGLGIIFKARMFVDKNVYVVFTMLLSTYPSCV